MLKTLKNQIVLAMWSTIAIMLVCIAVAVLIFLSGCQEQQRWGQGELPENHVRFFGKSNTARLDFVQNNAINNQGQIIAELVERVRVLEEINNSKSEDNGRSPDTTQSP